ncbi:hypothetical protein ACFLRA_01355 [Bdellovibrionota bacterium]
MKRFLLTFLSILVFPLVSFGNASELPHSKSIFPDVLLFQYHSTWTASDWTLDDLMNGRGEGEEKNYLAFVRNDIRSVPETTIAKWAIELGSREEAVARFGYSLEEVTEIIQTELENSSEDEVRTSFGYTPEEIANKIVEEQINRNETGQTLLTEEEQNSLRSELFLSPRFLNDSSEGESSRSLIKVDPYSEDLEGLTVVAFPIDDVEEVFREFSRWKRYGSLYRRSLLLDSKRKFRGLSERILRELGNRHLSHLPEGERTPDALEEWAKDSENNTWYHFYKSSAINIDWSGVSKFQRTEQSIPINDLYPSCEETTPVKRITLYYDLDPLFFPEQGEDFKYYNDVVEVSEGVVLFESFVRKNEDGTCSIDPELTIAFLKSLLRVDDDRIINESERDKRNTMKTITVNFVAGLKRRLRELKED